MGCLCIETNLNNKTTFCLPSGSPLNLLHSFGDCVLGKAAHWGQAGGVGLHSGQCAHITVPRGVKMDGILAKNA